MARLVTVLVTGVSLLSATAAGGQTLRGSSAAMQRQNRVAQQHDYTFLQTSSQVRKFVNEQYLVPIRGNSHYQLAGVSHPYGRPAMRLFVERLAGQYHSACGEKLVVTSLTRPVREQPRNASDLSVHPAGMAVDLRVSRRSSCRKWLESTLLSLEKQGVLDATRESRPPHYHVALFPTNYTRYVARLNGGSSSSTRLASSSTAPRPAAGAGSSMAARNGDGPGATVASGPSAGDDVQTYRVNRGDSLWSIARRHGTTVDTLKALNQLRGTSLVAGQVIQVPAAVAAGADES